MGKNNNPNTRRQKVVSAKQVIDIKEFIKDIQSEIKNEYGLTVGAFCNTYAKKVGIPENNLRVYLSGKVISLDGLQKIAKFFKKGTVTKKVIIQKENRYYLCPDKLSKK